MALFTQGSTCPKKAAMRESSLCILGQRGTQSLTSSVPSKASVNAAPAKWLAEVLQDLKQWK